MAFGEKLLRKLKEKNVTQAKLCEQAGIPPTTLSSMIKRNVDKVDIDVFLKICKALDCNPEEFYNECNPSKITPSFERKYNKIDDYGRKTVDAVLNSEYERCINTEGQEKQPTITISYSRLPASAGAGDFLQEENLEEREFPDTPTSRRADVVIPVDGDSMEPVFHDGDELYVRLQPAVNVGEIGIFTIDGNGYVKECGEDELISLNPDYPNIKPSEFADFRTVGKVLGKVE